MSPKSSTNRARRGERIYEMKETPNTAATGERMDPEHHFRFDCSPGVSCFTQCCQDVTIVLTPYDVMRLKERLGMSSQAFVDTHTIVLPKKGRLIPLVILKMREEDKRCPFVTGAGCMVYEDRPWPCRMFPLDMNDDGTFRTITSPERCQGFDRPETWRISEWLVAQGIVPYDQMNSLFAEITAPLQADAPDIDNPKITQMLFMAMYNLDRFRDFVFQSSFLKRFEVDPLQIEKIKRKDEELLKFAFNWIKFGLFGQLLFKIRQETSECAARPTAVPPPGDEGPPGVG